MSTTKRTVDEETPLLAEDASIQTKKKSPIPWDQFTILLLLQLAEPLTSQVIYPFLPQFVRDMNVTHGEETKVGYYVGLMQSLFFATQALTVLHWSRLSDHIGRKPVIMIGLFGISLSMYSFGLSQTFEAAVISRCLNGALNGNIGVLKSQFGALFDETNMAEAYAYLPLAWSTGSTLGPMIGGSLSRPADQFPDIFGNNDFLKRYPYFLPCAAPATFAALAWLVTWVWLKETVAQPVPIRRLLRLRRNQSNLVLQNVVEGADPTAAVDEGTSDEEKPYPLRKLFTKGIIIAGGNYASLSLVDIAYRGVLPVFLSTPTELGGLGFSPAQIGALLAAYGVTNGLFQIFLFAKINKHFGPKNAFMSGILATVVMFACFPLITEARARAGRIDALVWSLIVLQQLCGMLTSLSYGSVFIFITAASPNRASLGSTNGLCQMVVSWMRAFGPALANSLYSVSLHERSWTVYYVLESLSLVAIAGACLLPRDPWKK